MQSPKNFRPAGAPLSESTELSPYWVYIGSSRVWKCTTPHPLPVRHRCLTRGRRQGLLSPKEICIVVHRQASAIVEIELHSSSHLVGAGSMRSGIAATRSSHGRCRQRALYSSHGHCAEGGCAERPGERRHAVLSRGASEGYRKGCALMHVKRTHAAHV